MFAEEELLPEDDALEVTVAAAVAVAAEEAALLAMMVTVGEDGTVAGALYMPLVEMVPTVELPPATPFTVQFTAVLLVFETVALNCCVLPVLIETLVGLTVTETAGAAATLIDSALVVVCAVAAESFTCTVNDDEPDAVGVPETAPLDAFSVKPAGSEPDVMLHVYGVVPPEAASPAL